MVQGLGISPTTLKRLCRHYGIQRWPHRQICGIERTLSRLRAELAATAAERGSSAELLTALSAHIRELCTQRERVIEVRFVAPRAMLASLRPSPGAVTSQILNG